MVDDMHIIFYETYDMILYIYISLFGYCMLPVHRILSVHRDCLHIDVPCSLDIFDTEIVNDMSLLNLNNFLPFGLFLLGEFLVRYGVVYRLYVHVMDF